MIKELLFSIGDKVLYRTYDGKGKESWLEGTVFAVRTYEERGIVKRQTYLIDTGDTVREDVSKVNDKGKVLETIRQPEQVEVERKDIKKH